MTGPFDRRAQICSLAVRPRSKGRRSAVREGTVAPAKGSISMGRDARPPSANRIVLRL